MTGRVIESGGQKLSVLLPASWAQGLTFFSDPADFVQVGKWGYDRGVKLQAHIHNEVRREASRTQEVVLVWSGRLAASIFNEAGGLVERVELGAGDVLVLLAGGHGYEILEDGTRVLEIKNGPYPGPESDRKRVPWP